MTSKFQDLTLKKVNNLKNKTKLRGNETTCSRKVTITRLSRYP